MPGQEIGCERNRGGGCGLPGWVHAGHRVPRIEVQRDGHLVRVRHARERRAELEGAAQVREALGRLRRCVKRREGRAHVGRAGRRRAMRRLCVRRDNLPVGLVRVCRRRAGEEGDGRRGRDGAGKGARVLVAQPGREHAAVAAAEEDDGLRGHARGGGVARERERELGVVRTGLLVRHELVVLRARAAKGLRSAVVPGGRQRR